MMWDAETHEWRMMRINPMRINGKEIASISDKFEQRMRNDERMRIKKKRGKQKRRKKKK